MQALESLNAQILDIEGEVSRLNVEYQAVLRDIAGHPNPETRARAAHVERQIATHRADLKVMYDARGAIEEEAKSEAAVKRRADARDALVAASKIAELRSKAAGDVDKALAKLEAEIAHFAEISAEMNEHVAKFFRNTIPNVDLRMNHCFGVAGELLNPSGNNALAWALSNATRPLNVHNALAFRCTTDAYSTPSVKADAERYSSRLLTRMANLAVSEGVVEEVTE
jgi:isoleucyl-tRNA synthetase